MSKSAMQKALDALEREQVMAQDNNGDYTINVTPKHITEAIVELRAALAELEPSFPDNIVMSKTWFDADKGKLITEYLTADEVQKKLGIHIPVATSQEPAQAEQILRMLVNRAKSFPSYPIGGHIPEAFAYFGERSEFEPAPAKPLSARDVELIDGMIDVQLDHAKRCDSIPNKYMAEKQKGWDMERVELLRRIKANHGIKETS